MGRKQTKTTISGENKTITLELDCAKAVGYPTLLKGISPVNRLYIKNISDTDISELSVQVYSRPEFILPLKLRSQLLPRLSTLKFESDIRLSPLFFVSQNERTEGEIIVEVGIDGKTVLTETERIALWAFDECDFGVSQANLAYFIKRTAFVNEILRTADGIFTEWKTDKSPNVRVGGKNYIRNRFASVYAAVAGLKFTLKDHTSSDLIISPHDRLKSTLKATAPEIALLLASAAEAAGMNVVLAEYDTEWLVGVFLTDECFSEVVSDDPSRLIKLTERGVNGISAITVSDMTRGMAFESNEKATSSAIKKTLPKFVLDVKRARIMKLFPMPDRIKTLNGYNLADSKDYDLSRVPSAIAELDGDFSGDKNLTRVKQWERRLLDLDMRNPLLNFKVGQFSLKILTASISDFCQNIADADYELRPATGAGLQYLKDADKPFDKASALRPLADYVAYEYVSGKLVSSTAGKELDKTLANIYRKEKSHQEETGTASLYLAAGFIKYADPEDKDYKFAPILLFPVTMTRHGAACPSYFLTVSREEAHINYTILEYLYHQYNLDLRGMGELKLAEGDNLRAAVDRIRKEAASFKNWEVYDTVYLCSLSFANYLMWSDVRTHGDKFGSNTLIKSLMDNRSYFSGADMTVDNLSSDGCVTGEDKIYLPINADSSQYSAIVDSLSKSFVLHGPPGTGKSQTITNIIVNNIVRGKKVLFVAEKEAALDVVAKRLKDIGISDFCLQLYSDKIKKTEVVTKLIHTLGLKNAHPESDYNPLRAELKALTEKLGGELEAMHRKQSLGFSIYEGIMQYLYNSQAPDCLHIDNGFYEKLTAKTYNEYISLLTELAARAKECGNIEKSPFKRVGTFEYTNKWRIAGENILMTYQFELRHLREYAKALTSVFNLRTVSLTGRKLKGLFDICSLLGDPVVEAFFRANRMDGYGEITAFLGAATMRVKLEEAFVKNFGALPVINDYDEIIAAEKNDKAIGKLTRRYASSKKFELTHDNREAYFAALLKLAKNRAVYAKRLSTVAEMLDRDPRDEASVLRAAGTIKKLFDVAITVYPDSDIKVFRESCMYVYDNSPFTLPEYYCSAYRNCLKAEEEFKKLFHIMGDDDPEEEINKKFEELSDLQANLDLIAGWCKYRNIVERCAKNGFEFVIEPLMRGEITAADILACFKKCIFKTFVQSEIALDDRLCSFSGLTMEQTIEAFRAATEQFERAGRVEIYYKLMDMLPSPEQEGEHNLEKVVLVRAEKSGMKGITLRKLFGEIPHILAYACPCMLMSPTSVTQFLDMDAHKFDLVVFDEASQVPTCKAVGTIARADRVIVVGDPQQLPPTTFFGAEFKDDETVEVEDLDSILDDCLAIGMPERHLKWHYRSRHESLIAFSNSMYYDNSLLTFPSPSERASVVSLKYVEGVYDRGGKKINKAEADELIKEVIQRLKTKGNKQSIGIVTFNTAQQNYIYDKLTAAIHSEGLESVAYDVPEPVFVKNLESVQGDERDLILFSVGYGPDATGKLSLNFGPLNQTNGYRRLNVAVTRARVEMRVFSSITGNMIDLNRTDSAGVRGLKAFLEYAERGKEMLVLDRKQVADRKSGIGELIAGELRAKGIACDHDLGVSDFRIDVAVVDPKDRNRYMLAVICDGENERRINGVKDRVYMQTKVLKTLGWNVYYMWTVNYFGNPKREIQKLKDYIQKLTESRTAGKKSISDAYAKYKRIYKSYLVKPLSKVGPEYILSGMNTEAVTQRAKAIIEVEQPIDSQSLIEKLSIIYNIPKTNKKAYAALSALDGLDALKSEEEGVTYYMTAPPATFRPIDQKNKREFSRICLAEISAAVRCAVEAKISLTKDELIAETATLLGVTRRNKAINDKIERAIALAVSGNYIIATVDDKYTI